MIPLSIPNISGNEWKYIKECLDTNWISSVGKYVDLFEQKIAEYTGAKYAIATSNGTAALHISLILAGVTADDCVIVPNVTFIASLNSIKYTGATPILMDVCPKTWQMDFDLLAQYLKTKTHQINGVCVNIATKKTIKAIMPVHIMGNMADMNKLCSLAKKHNIKVIEDATEALGTKLKEQHAGTFGMLGCFSFNGNKILTTGGGGMIITNNEALAKKAKHLTTQAKSDAFEYIHDEVGYNYRLVNVLAAMGVAQMEQLPSFITKKKHIADYYKENIKTTTIQLQQTEVNVSPNNWMITINAGKNKTKLIDSLVAENIQVRPLWKPMNQLDMFRDYEYFTENDTSNTLYKSCISLPASTTITIEELQKVVTTINKFYEKN